MKTKYILGTIVMGMITLYSMNHLEKYNVAIPIIFGVLTITSIALALTDLKSNKK